jgi:fatty-acyl-CoA synthase
VNLSLLLEIAAEGMPDRTAIVCGDQRLSYSEVLGRSRDAAGLIQDAAVDNVAYIALNSAAVAIGLFGAAMAGCPFAPLNYRLTDVQLAELVGRLQPALVVAAPAEASRVATVHVGPTLDPSALTSGAAAGPPPTGGGAAPDAVGVLLFTSGTTGEPKAAVLRHRHLTSYILESVDPYSAEEDEAVLVSVPPYHVAGIAAILSSVYAGRRLVYLQQFEPQLWVDTVRKEAITHAMVVPTMLQRILELLERDGAGLPSLRHLSYGGGRMPLPVIESALELLPGVDLVNAYGLTETSSTIAVLGPEDHRVAVASTDPVVRRRLTSVGRALPTVAIQIRDVDGNALAPNERGEIWVSGDQVAGEYLGRSSSLVDGWFPTRDGGWLDEEAYLFVDGRLDDVIVRGGENISPGEIEDVLREHPAVCEVAVVGIPDVEWGESVTAVVVLHSGGAASAEDLREWVKERLRSAKTPQTVLFQDALPYNETGKLLRRVLRAELVRPDQES